MKLIKVGKYRINAAHVAYVTERISKDMQQRSDGTWTENSYAKDEDKSPGLVVDVNFPAMNQEYEMSIRLYMDEAKTFLDAYDQWAERS